LQHYLPRAVVEDREARPNEIFLQSRAVVAAMHSLKLIEYHNHGHANGGSDQNVLNNARVDCARNEGTEHFHHLALLVAINSIVNL
jgi:hypothetical protein